MKLKRGVSSLPSGNVVSGSLRNNNITSQSEKQKRRVGFKREREEIEIHTHGERRAGFKREEIEITYMEILERERDTHTHVDRRERRERRERERERDTYTWREKK